MAEKDPCELVIPVQEEEVSPEYQETTPQTGVPTLPGVVMAATGPSTAALQVTPQQQALQAGIRASQNEAVRQVMNDMEVERVQRSLNGELGEGLQNDVSLTPVFQNKLSAEKSTWIITNTSLLDFGISGPDSTEDEGESRFFSKPDYLLHSFIGTTNTRSPANVIDSQYRIDPLRWIGDRMWFNAGHLNGPEEYDSTERVKSAHGNFRGPDFYFINSEKGIFDRGWAKLYIDGSKNLHIKLGGGYNRSTWKNLEDVLQRINASNSSGFKVKYEHHEVVGVKSASSTQDWSWRDYFYGNVREEISTQIVPSRGSSSQKREAFREHANRQDANVGWRGINRKYSRQMNFANLNPFPVIPFYGESFSLNQNTDPSRLESPPTVGSVMFEDFTTNVTDLLSKQEADVVDIGNKSYFDIRTVYSYFDCLYERVFSPVIDELELPSPYLKKPRLAFETSGLRTQGLSTLQREDFERLVFSRMEIIDLLMGTDFLSNNTTEVSEIVRPSQQVEYFEDLIRVGDRDSKRKMAEIMSDYYGFNIGNTTQDIYLSNRTTEELDLIYNERYLNPMFVEMELGSIEKSQLAEAMTFNGDNTLVRSMFSALIRRQDTEETTTRSFLSGINLTIRNTDIVNASYVDQLVQSGINRPSDSLSTKIQFSDTIKMEEALSLDFSEWFDSVFDYYTTGMNAPTSPIEKFANIFRLLTIRAKIASFVNSRSRTYPQIISGVPAKSEVLGFTIDKYEISRNGSETYINSFHILSNNDRQVERFIDSQVKYGKVYEYKINRIVAIVGNKYAYLDPGQRNSEKEKQKEDTTKSLSSDAEYRQKFGIVNVPTLKIMSIPSTSRRVAVSDRPPIYPNIDFVPFKNVKDKVLINLSSNTGEYLSPPILLQEDDSVQFYVVAASQGLPSVQSMSLQQARSLGYSFSDTLSESEMIRFRSDDPATVFEIFRIEHHPSSYQDFVGNMIRKESLKSDNFSFIDNLTPDKKYYYVFRTEDVHGHVSNPSHIYEVQLLTYNEAVRLSIKIVEPIALIDREIQDLVGSKKDLRIFVSIKPTMRQRRLMLPDSGKFSDLVEMSDSNQAFGDEGIDKIWGKKFKLRIRSKNTGKEVDVNFRFNTRVKKNEQNKKVNLIC